MYKLFRILILCFMLFFAACTSQVDHKGKTPLVEMNGSYLYREDLLAMIPLGLTPTDSADFAERCIRDWAEEQLLYHQAERNIRSSQLIEQRVEDYRKALIMQEYQQLLVEQELSTEITERDMRLFYNSNRSIFLLQEPVIRGIFIKVPKTSSGLNDLKKWYTRSDDETLEKIEKYCLQHALVYDYFYDQWVSLSDLDGKIGTNLIDLSKGFKEKKDFLAEDDEFCYLLHVQDVIQKGEPKPFELVRNEIYDLLVNQRKVDFIKQVRSKLYERSMQKGNIHRFDNNNEANN